MKDGTDLLINSLGGGGAERQVVMLAARLPDARIVTLEGKRNYATDAPRLELAPVTSESSAATKLLALPLQLGRLVRAVRGVPVVSFLWRSNVMNVLASFLRRHPMVLSERQAMTVGAPSPMRTLFLKALGVLYRRAELVVVNAQGTRDDLIRWCGLDPERVRVIYNAVDAERIARLGQESADVPARYLVTSARLDPQKGQDNLLRAFAEIAETHPDVQLLVLGEGPHEGHLKELARILGIGNRVRFLGFRENPFAWIAKAEAFVLTSHFEGFPNVVLEALALGVPVVAADCPHGPRELLAPETDRLRIASEAEEVGFGILVPPMIPGARATDEPLTMPERKLAQALARILDEPALRARYAAAGPARLDEFAPDVIADEWRLAINAVRR